MGIFDGGVDEFQIRNLNVKDGGYEAGDTITGEVIMVAKKEIKCREFVATLVGTAHTEWQRMDRSCGDNNTCNNEHYLGNEKITEDCKVFNGPGLIAPGQYVHKFVFRLPSRCPPSYAGLHGHIAYLIKAKLDRPMAVDSEVTTAVMVKGLVDLNTLPPQIKEPVDNQGMEEIGGCCCKDGRVRIRARTTKGAYALGENVEMQLEVDNYTSKTISTITANVMENTTFIAYRGIMWGFGGEQDRMMATRTVVSASRQVNIPPQTQQKIDFTFTIPKIIPPRIECSIIQTQHAIQMCAMLDKGSRASTCILPIAIGTIPLGASAPTMSIF